ncbi:unnamed protein product, partial [Lymnaea stagnalis]
MDRMDWFDFYDMFIFLAVTGCEALVHEKEAKLKESMSLMGMTKYAYWSAWFTLSFIWICILIAGTAVLLFTPLFGEDILLMANPFLVVLLMLVLAVDIHFFSLLLSCFAQNVNDVSTIFIMNYLFFWLSRSLYRRINSTA